MCCRCIFLLPLHGVCVVLICLDSVPSVPSGHPEDVRGQPIDSRTIKITWSPPHPSQQNGDLLGYKVLYVREDSPLGPGGAPEINVLPSEHSATISNLDKWTEYKVWVKAYTRVGDGPLSPVIIVLTDEDGMSAPHEAVTTYIVRSTDPLLMLSARHSLLSALYFALSLRFV